MPSGLKRFQRAEALHFVTFSCFHRLPLLQAPQARELVEALLEQTRERHQARIYAYVLMPEHVHLLVNEPPRILLAQFLESRQADHFVQAERSVREVPAGPLLRLQRPRGRTRSEVIRYIHRNPVPPQTGFHLWGGIRQSAA